jgi:hypothetical protein
VIRAAVVLAIATAAPARARAEIHLATLEATSSERDAHLALDGDARTAWCPIPRDREGTLTIEFERPLAIGAIRIEHGGAARLLRELEVAVDGGAPDVMRVLPGEAETLAIEAASARSLVLRPSGRGRCIPDLFLLDEHVEVISVVAGIDRAALDSLRGALLAIGGALARRDEAALAEFVDLPLRARWGRDRLAVRDARALAELVREEGRPALGDVERALAWAGSPAPGEIVLAAHAGTELWRLRWERGAWRLVSVSGVR